MPRTLRSATALLSIFASAALAAALGPGAALAAARRSHPVWTEPPQETGFLNRRIEMHGVTYRFQVYLPEEWRRDDRKHWPIILFLHGRGERGSEGMWQTQIGLPQSVRDHPDRWPFLIVMPQCPLDHVWTDPDMLAMAMATLDQETAEFHADLDRTYLMGLSLGGYGAWELARNYPHRWAAIALAASGIFWSYAPERWLEVASLPGDYARAVGRTPIWLFHGLDDPVVAPRESELMYDALKASGGHVRLWLYQNSRHDCWTRAFNEPELPRWLLAHRTGFASSTASDATPGSGSGSASSPAAGSGTASTTAASPVPTTFAERLVIPFHPAALKLAPAVLDSFAGVYNDKAGHPTITIYRQGEQLFEKNLQGEIAELAAESSSVFFYLNGSSITRLTFEHDAQGRVTTLLLRDDRHEERWEKRIP